MNKIIIFYIIHLQLCALLNSHLFVYTDYPSLIVLEYMQNGSLDKYLVVSRIIIRNI